MNADKLLINLGHLRTFVTVFTEGNYTSAARLLGCSVPGLWQQVRALEQHYGTALFVRHGRGVRPTDAGRVLQPVIAEILESAQRSFALLRGEHVQAKISLVVAASLSLDVGQILGHLRRRGECEATRVGVERITDRAVFDAVAAGGADVGVGLFAGTLPEGRDVLYEKIGRVRSCVVFPPAEGSGPAKAIELGELIKQPLILSPAGTPFRNCFENVLAEAGLADNLNVVVETELPEVLIDCVRAGLGVGIAATPTTLFVKSGLQTAALQGDSCDLGVVLIVRSGKGERKIVKTLLESLRTCLKDAIGAGGNYERVKKHINHRRIRVAKPPDSQQP